MSVRATGPGQVGVQGNPGTPGTNGTNGSNGANGIVPMFNSSGLMSGVKAWVGTATTNASGQWSVNYASAGFTSIATVQPAAISSGLTAGASVGASFTSPTLTGCSGMCWIPNAISLLGILPLQAAGAGIVVQVLVIGT